MSTTTTTDLAEHVIAILRAHDAELRRAGISRLSLFGSVVGVPSRQESADSLAGADHAAFAGNGLLRDAVERCMERVCEAAHRLGERAAELMPNQPWSDIRGMGNRLRHAYDRISLDVIWNAARHDLPGLAADARRAPMQLRGSIDS